MTVVTVVLRAVESGRCEAFVRCLVSVQSQEGVRIEHVIVDGGSSDGTLELLRTVPCRHPLVVVSEPDNGIYDAMNKGLRKARGTYVIFLNSDDFYHDRKGLRLSVDELERTGADFSYAPAIVINELGRFAASHPHISPNPQRIFTEMPFSHQAMLTRREVFARLGGFDLAYRSSSDYDFLLRMVFAGSRACRVPQAFVTFAMGGYSIQNIEKANREVAEIYSRLYSRACGEAFPESDALQAYLQKTLSPKMVKTLLPFVQATFGTTAQPQHDEAKVSPLEDFRRYLLPDQQVRSRLWRHLKVLCGLARHPILSGRYLLITRKLKGRVHDLRLKPVAYDELAHCVNRSQRTRIK